MQVFKAYLKILNRNKIGMLIYIGIFFALTLVMGANGKKNDIADFSQVSLKIGVDNQDEGELGEALVEYLSLKNEIKEVPKDREKLLDEMYYWRIDYVLVIPKEFTKECLSGNCNQVVEGIKVPGSNTAYLAETEVQKFMKTLNMYLDAGFMTKEAAAQTLTDMQEESSVEFLSQENAEERPGAYYYFMYIPYIFLCVMIMGMSVVLMAFGKKDIDARNKCSAMSFAKRNLQLILGSGCVMFFILILFLGAASILYPDYMMGIRGILSAINCVAYMLVCLSIAFFVGRIAKNVGQLNMVANVVGLGFSFLGGVFVPLELLGDGVKQISKFLPSYWYIISNEEIWKMRSMKDAGDMYINFLVLGAFAIAILAVAMMVNRLKARET